VYSYTSLIPLLYLSYTSLLYPLYPMSHIPPLHLSFEEKLNLSYIHYHYQSYLPHLIYQTLIPDRVDLYLLSLLIHILNLLSLCSPFFYTSYTSCVLSYTSLIPLLYLPSTSLIPSYCPLIPLIPLLYLEPLILLYLPHVPRILKLPLPISLPT